MATVSHRRADVAKGHLIIGATLLIVSGFSGVRAQEQPPAVTFKAGVDMVRIAAVVRDHKGRFVQDLKKNDFVVLDGGQTRNIADFRNAPNGLVAQLAERGFVKGINGNNNDDNENKSPRWDLNPRPKVSAPSSRIMERGITKPSLCQRSY